MKRRHALLFAFGSSLVVAAACANGTTSDTDALPPDASAPTADAGSDDAVEQDAADESAHAADASDAPDASASVDAFDASLGDTSTAEAAVDSGSDTNNAPDAAVGTCVRSQWVATASDTYSANPAAYTLDGLPPTRWSSGIAQAAGQSFQLDFGGLITANSVRFDNTGGSASDYLRSADILPSADGITFNAPLASISNAQDPGATFTVAFPATTVRALRIRLTAASSAWWSIHELQVSCRVPGTDGGVSDAGVEASSDAAPLPDAGTNPNYGHWTATASNTGGGDVVTNAFDGNLGTRWTTGKAEIGDEWFRLDLGVTATVSQVWLDAQGLDFPSAYRLELSTDDIHYTAVATGLGASLTQITCARQPARYVRIDQIGVNPAVWWSIHEITIIE